jgi:phytol kinase
LHNAHGYYIILTIFYHARITDTIIIMEKTKKRAITNEVERKLVHMAHTLTIAFMVMNCSYTTIISAEIIFLILVSVVRKMRWFHSLQEVDRVSYGEFFMPIAFIILAAFNTDKWIFLASVLHLAFADVAAALVGTVWGGRQYGMFGLKKTVIGTSAFVLVSIITVSGILSYGLPITNYGWLITIAFVAAVATIMENTSPLGSDNLTIPLSVTCMLYALT